MFYFCRFLLLLHLTIKGQSGSLALQHDKQQETELSHRNMQYNGAGKREVPASNNMFNDPDNNGFCVLNGAGNYGKASSNVVPVMFEYDLEIKPQGAFSANIIPTLEKAYALDVAESLGICTKSLRRLLHSHRLQQESTAIGVGLLPVDSAVDDGCTASLDNPTNLCIPIRGQISVYFDENEVVDRDYMTSIILDDVQSNFGAGKYNGVHESIVKVTFDDGSNKEEKTAPTSDEQQSPLAIVQIDVRALEESSEPVQQNAGIAFVLVLAAAAATALGSSLVFFPRLVHLANQQTLAFALSMSAGVMAYISLVDIYSKSIGGFEEQGHEEGKSFIYATLSFFGGIFIMMGLNRIFIERFLMKRCGASHTIVHGHDQPITLKIERATNSIGMEDFDKDSKDDSIDPLDNLQEMTDEIIRQENAVAQDKEANAVAGNKSSSKNTELMQMGIATALAVALHNLPEGLVTFIAYMNDPTVGIVLTIGIALHNIPEGVCVALPIYYATGHRCKAFWWGTLSGISEPLGALIGWVILKQSGFSGNTYGIMFGLVSGIMIFITIDELLPTAFHYDPKNKHVTYAFILGMSFIAISLMLFSA